MSHPPELKIRAASLVLVLLFLLTPNTHVFAQPPAELTLNSGSDTGPWNLQAKSMQVFKKRKVVEAKGDVLLSRGGNSLQADFARYFWDTNWVFLRGNIKARFGSDTLQAETAEFDLQNEVGWLKEGQVFLEGPHLYLTGDYLKKSGPQTYSFEQAEVTACDGPTPAWSLKTSRGKITLDGYAQLWHPRFQIKDQPVLYSPYMVLPAKRQRQSGFLRPEFSSSDRDGIGLNLPYFKVLGPEQDATLYANTMSERGLMLGLEYRATPDLLSKILYRADWLNDSITADTEADEFEQFRGDGLARPNDNRYWIRGKLDGHLFTPEWKTKLDVDLVSDQNYLRDFDSGLNGFEASRETFVSEFGRDINDKDSLTRESVFQLSRNWSRVGLYSQMAYTQNLAYMNDNLPEGRNPTLQRLPELGLNIFQGQLLSTPLQWEADNEITYFWREFGITGLRTDIHPQISLPLSSTYATVIPRVGWRQTLYTLDSLDGRTRSRGLFDARVTTFSNLERIYNLSEGTQDRAGLTEIGDSRWTAIKHNLQPEIEWSYVSDEDQDDLPEFDELDRIEPENELTYTLTSVFTRRRASLEQPTRANTDASLVTDYLDFCQIELEQSYDFEEASRDRDRDTYPRRPFSDIRAEVSLRPLPWLSLSSTTWFSPYETTVTEHEHMLYLRGGPSRAYFGLDYRREMEEDFRRRNQREINVLRVGAHHSLSPSWQVGLDIQHDVKESENIQQTFRVGYRHQCWGLDMELERSPNETRVTVLVNLLQIGQFGESFAAGM